MINRIYKVLGFLFLNGRRHFTDPDEYVDWVNRCYSSWEIKQMLHLGQFPEGLIFSGPDGAVVVNGRNGSYDQKLIPLEEVVILSKPKPKGLPTVNEIADQMVELRGFMNLTQFGMANYLGLSHGTISRIEDGIRNFQGLTALKLEKLIPNYQNWLAKQEEG
ncbi:MAG: helix-turn-helix transcriptional regulator [Chloroflexota bacterium]|nr:helix-turn-helix transcriptional regulator [Chloroflexota bacterium]